MKPVLARRPAARLDTTGLSRVLPQIQSLIDASRQHAVYTAIHLGGNVNSFYDDPHDASTPFSA